MHDAGIRKNQMQVRGNGKDCRVRSGDIYQLSVLRSGYLYVHSKTGCSQKI